MTNLAPLWSALSEVDQRAGSLATTLPLLSVSKSRGIIRYEELFPDRVIRADDLGHYKVVEPGQIVLNKMSAATGAVGRANERGLVSPDYAVLSPSDDSDSRYLSYLLGSEGFCKNEVEPRLQGIGVGDVSNARTPRVTMTSYLSPVAFLPQVGNQRVIADYLDRETGEIDAMIAKMDELEDTLEVRRERVIDDALFTSAPRATLGHVLDCLPGYAFPSGEFTSNEHEMPLLRGVNVKPGGLDWTESVYWPLADVGRLESYLIVPGDIVLGMDRPFVESGTRVVRVTLKDPISLLVQRVLRVRPVGETSAQFIYYALRSRAFRDYVTPETTGISVPHISEGQVRGFRLPIPTPKEQRRIADHLDEVTGKIDAMLAKVAELRSLLIERRAALITDVVTGRKAVA